jgi:hypothetical protein
MFWQLPQKRQRAEQPWEALESLQVRDAAVVEIIL